MPRPLPGISPRAWEHPADAAALAALRRLPGFDVAVKKTLGKLNEWQAMRQVATRGVRVDADHPPEVHQGYAEVLRTLDAPEAPPLYVVEMPVINAATMGMDEPLVLLSDKAVEQLPAAQVRSILAHELGHVMSGHLLYKMMLRTGLYLGWAALGFPLSAPLVAAVVAGLLEWDRKSELSADRASLLALQDLDAVAGTLAAVSARHKAVLDASNEEAGIADEHWRRFVGVVMAIGQAVSRHPPVDKRVAELERWVASGEYDRILAGDYPRRGEEPADPTWLRVQEAAAHLGGELKSQAETLGEGLDELSRPAREWLGEAADRLGDWIKKRE